MNLFCTCRRMTLTENTLLPLLRRMIQVIFCLSVRTKQVNRCGHTEAEAVKEPVIRKKRLGLRGGNLGWGLGLVAAAGRALFRHQSTFFLIQHTSTGWMGGNGSWIKSVRSSYMNPILQYHWYNSWPFFISRWLWIPGDSQGSGTW